MLRKIFLSYRRADTGPMTGRLSDRLRDVFPSYEVFMDVDSIAPGQDWKSELEHQIALSDIILVMIGSRWLEELDPETGSRRIDSPNDFVRFEIASAIRRGLFVQPVLVDGATMPAENDLPDDIKPLCRHNAISITTRAFHQDTQPLIKRIKELSPGWAEALLHGFVNTPTYVMLISMLILSSLTLFAARMLDISIFTAPIVIDSKIEHLKGVTIDKELGYFFTINWSLFIFLLMPIAVFLLHATMQEGSRLIAELNLKKMLVYIDPDGQRIVRPSTELWGVIVRRTATFALIMCALGFSLGLFQWYAYSGQWYFRGFELKSFLETSTGADWQVSWALLPSLEGNGLAITGFALWNYLFYGLGWAAIFIYYMFVFILINELQQVAQRIGRSKAGTIQVAVAERTTGGFGSLASIQRYHGWLCAVAVLNMFAMALRNTYLPHSCNAFDPASVAPGTVPAHCTSMLGMIEAVLQSGYSTIKNVITGQSSDLSQLFFTYTPSNEFTLGALYHILIIACFFFFISTKMRSIVESARANTAEASEDIGRPLVRELAVNGRLTFVMIVAGAMAAVFVNMLLIYLLLLAVFWIVQIVRRPLQVSP